MRSQETVSEGEEITTFTEEQLADGKDFIARVREHIAGLSERRPGQPVVRDGNVAFEPRKNERLFFISRGVMTKEKYGVTIDGHVITLGAPETLAQRQAIAVNHIDIPTPQYGIPYNAYISSLPETDLDPNGTAVALDCVFTFDRYRVVDLSEHDLAVVKDE